jgi:hypothetical protein
MFEIDVQNMSLQFGFVHRIGTFSILLNLVRLCAVHLFCSTFLSRSRYIAQYQ